MLWILMLLSSLGSLDAFSSEEELYKSTITPSMVLDHRNWYLRLSALTSPMPGGLIGGGLIVGKHLDQLITLDAKFEFITGTFGALMPERDLLATESTNSIIDPGAEINNRNRTSLTPASGILFGPALGVHSNILKRFSPKLTEQGRLGFLYGSITDATNAITFTSILVFAEASILYQFTDDGAWTVDAHVSANSGRGMNHALESGTQARIPLLFGNVGLSLSHWF